MGTWDRANAKIGAITGFTRGGIQKEDGRYNPETRVEQPTVAQPLYAPYPVQPSGQSALYYGGHPQFPQSSPFLNNTTPSSPPQGSPPQGSPPQGSPLQGSLSQGPQLQSPPPQGSPPQGSPPMREYTYSPSPVPYQEPPQDPGTGQSYYMPSQGSAPSYVEPNSPGYTPQDQPRSITESRAWGLPPGASPQYEHIPQRSATDGGQPHDTAHSPIARSQTMPGAWPHECREYWNLDRGICMHDSHFTQEPIAYGNWSG